MHILVVEDEKKVASFIQRGLEAEHYTVDVAYDGEVGLVRVFDGNYDLLILDVMLPKRDGLSVLQEVRRHKLNLPVLLLTARDTVADKVAGLDRGADDYLTKPFAFEELLARVRALLRRGTPMPAPVLALADLRLDLVTRQVTRAGRRIDLTAKEFALLEFFLRQPGRVLSRTLIAQHVWGVDFDTFTNVIDVYINALRKKLEQPGERPLIHTHRGVGYSLRDPEVE